jgi:hypothetical protein
VAGPYKIVFLLRNNFIFVAVSDGVETERLLRGQLESLHAHIVSSLTTTAIKLYLNKPQCDLRDTLQGDWLI